MVKGEQLSKKYGDLVVLKNVSLHIKAAEIVAIVGPSGAGKTTLLQLLGTLDKPDSGTLSINNRLISGLNEKELAKFRNEQIGFVFQFHQLLPEFTALENICLPAMIAKTNGIQHTKKANELLKMLGLSNRASHKPKQLSGGEAQRIAVARALINSPAVVFADEPSGNLDSKNADELHQLFFTLRQELGQTFVIVTHNNSFADSTDRKITLRDGEII